MSLRRDVPCRFCGHVNETGLLDPAYSEYNSFFRLRGSWDRWFDYKFMILKCNNCKQNNWIYWYRPLN